MSKGKEISVQAGTSRLDSRSLKFPEFLDNLHMKVAWLSVLSTAFLYPPEDTSGSHFC